MKETFYTIPGCPLSFALLADLHNKPFDEIITSLRSWHPQMIFIAGDIVYGGSRPEGDELVVDVQQNVLPFLRSCAAIAPTYLSLGNHERILCEDDYAKIRQTGVVILDNGWMNFETEEGASVFIGGLTSGYVIADRKARKLLHTMERYPQIYSPLSPRPYIKPDVIWLGDFAKTPGYHILLCHHPEYIDLIPENIELILSGHAHGGQWNFWSFRNHRWRGVFAPGQGLFPRYTSGVYQNRMIVSRGLANTHGCRGSVIRRKLCM